MKKNFIKKLLIGGLITSLCLCCCFLNFNKNVNASAVNKYQELNNWFENATFVPDRFTSLDDLKGKTFNFNDYFSLELNYVDLSLYINILERDYIGIEIDEETHETIQCIDYLQYPYLVYSTFNLDTYEPEIYILSFYQESSSTYSILFHNDIALNPNCSLNLNGSTLLNNNNFYYLPINEINEVNDIPFYYIEATMENDLTFISRIFNHNFLSEENFLNSLNSSLPGVHSFYLCFPNTDRYSLGFVSSLSPGIEYLFFENFDYVQPYNANIEDKINYGEMQYTSGYNKGISDATDGEYRFYFLTGIFNAVSDILAIEIFPNVQIGYFILVPLALGITGMIFYFWRKD